MPLHPTSSPKLNLKLLALLIGYVVLIVLIWDTVVFYPIRIMVVFYHELSHALAAIITVFDLKAVSKLVVTKEEAGLTMFSKGFVPVVASAGYLGTTLIGAFLLRLGFLSPSTISFWIYTIAITTIVMGILYVVPSGDAFSIAVAALSATFMFILAKLRIKKLVVYITQFLGVSFLAYSIYDFLDFVYDAKRTDAGILARYFGMEFLTIPIALFWVLLSLYIIYSTAKKVIYNNG